MKNHAYSGTVAVACFVAIVGFVGAAIAENGDAAGVAAGEPRAGGRPEKNVRFVLPPAAGAAEPAWTKAEKARGYAVYSDSYLNSFWPEQKPTREQIVDKVGCRLARDEYEPIQVGVYGVGGEKALENVAITVDIDLSHEIRVLGFRERDPSAKELDSLGAVPVPYVLELGKSIEKIEPQHTGTFWITFHATAETTAGKHAGTIRLGPQGKPASEIALTVEVLPFVLPKPDIAFGMYFYQSNAWQRDNLATAEKDQAAHGMNSATLYAMPPGIKLVKDEVTPKGRIEFAKAVVEEMESRIANGLADPNIPTFLADYDLVNWHSGSVADKLALEEKLHVGRLYNTYSVQHGWPPFAVQMHDEPTVKQPKSFFTWSEGWKRSDVLTATAMSGKAAAAMGYLHDVWIVHTGQITPEMVREAGRQGAEVWTYTYSMGAYNALSNRYMAGIYTWALKLRGNYQWAYYHNDHFIIGQGSDPAPLVSWEGRREGVDDYRYLMTVEALLADTDPKDAIAREARVWLDKLHTDVDLVFFHGFSGSSRVDGPFCYPASGMEIADYDQLRARAADYCLKLGLVKRRAVQPVRPAVSLASKWEAAAYENESVEVCIAALSSPLMHRRRSAAAALAMRGKEAAGAVDKLTRLLGDPDVRIVAMRALNAIGPDAGPTVGAIAEYLTHGDDYVRMSAAFALGNLGADAVPALRKALYDDAPDVGAIACDALANLGGAAGPAVPELIAMLDNARARRGAVLALQGIGPAAAPAVDALARVFGEVNGKNEYIARALGNIGVDALAAVDILEKHRDLQYWSVATNAALFKIRGDRTDLEMLVDLLTEGQDGYCTERAAAALEDLGADAGAIAPRVARLMKEKAEFFKKYKGPVAQLENFLNACKDAGVSLDVEEVSPEVPEGEERVLLEESFDVPGVKDGQSVNEAPIKGWRLRDRNVCVSNKTAFGDDTFALHGRGPHWGGTAVRAFGARPSQTTKLVLTFQAFVAEKHTVGEETMITVNDHVGFDCAGEIDGPVWSYNSGAGGWSFDARAAGGNAVWKLGKVGTNQIVTCKIVWDIAKRKTWGTIEYQEGDKTVTATSVKVPITKNRLRAIRGVVYYNAGYNNGPNYGIDLDNITVTESRLP